MTDFYAFIGDHIYFSFLLAWFFVHYATECWCSIMQALRSLFVAIGRRR